MSDDRTFVDCCHFAGPVTSVTEDLVGRTLSVRGEAGSETRALLIEVEGYGGPEDPASHAAFRANGRARIMWDAPGTVYVYAAYGVYPCLNIVTGRIGEPSAVLVRGVWLEGEGQPILGPGRSSRALGVTVDDHGESCCGMRFSVSRSRRELPIRQTPRVGVTRGVEHPWRYVATLET